MAKKAYANDLEKYKVSKKAYVDDPEKFKEGLMLMTM